MDLLVSGKTFTFNGKRGPIFLLDMSVIAFGFLFYFIFFNLKYNLTLTL